MAFQVERQEALGAVQADGGVRFAVHSETAERIWVCLFDSRGEAETQRVELRRDKSGTFSAFVPDLVPGARYGLRADGPYHPERGLWFDPEKLLVDPYALALDGAYAYDPALALPRGRSVDTAPLMPKAVVTALKDPAEPAEPVFDPGRLVYEVPVRAFSMLHPDVPAEKRGTVAALAEPAVIAHLKRLHVGAVELMPVTAWMDERHLGPLGLTNAWGYNPVTFMALDPRLAPGGVAELRRTVDALHAAGIGVILDVVFNHTAESDAFGPTLSLRGLDAGAYYRHGPGGALVNDTGTGNTLACDHPATQRLVLDALRHFVLQAGVDGFRFDLATILGRGADGFDAVAPLLQAMRADPVIASRVLLAEPWDIGPGGYQLGRFSTPFLEWSDRYRDEVRRFWRGDKGLAGTLATRLAGSFDIFPGSRTRTLNFLAAHDGMTLADTVAYERKHNEANGEENRDGHNENHSWNNGVEGPSANVAILARRRADIQALLATLFASRGGIMLTAGDEWGRTQNGNNNAYAQDNPRFWLDWENRSIELEEYTAALAAFRAAVPALGETTPLAGVAPDDPVGPGVAWLGCEGRALSPAEWQDPERRRLAMVVHGDAAGEAMGTGGRFAVCINGDRRKVVFALPLRAGWSWRVAVEPSAGAVGNALNGPVIPGRSVVYMLEEEAG